jgi:hypothetical protein
MSRSWVQVPLEEMFLIAASYRCVRCYATIATARSYGPKAKARGTSAISLRSVAFVREANNRNEHATLKKVIPNHRFGLPCNGY